MQRKILAVAVAGLLSLSVLMPSVTYAKSPDGISDPTESSAYQETEIAGVTPDQFLYFLDILIEKIQLFFAGSTITRAELSYEFALEKEAEFKLMVENEDDQASIVSLDQFLIYMEELRNQIQNAIAQNLNISNLEVEIDALVSDTTKSLEAELEVSDGELEIKIEQVLNELGINSEEEFGDETEETEVENDDVDDDAVVEDVNTEETSDEEIEESESSESVDDEDETTINDNDEAEDQDGDDEDEAIENDAQNPDDDDDDAIGNGSTSDEVEDEDETEED
ncbi:MAG: DUF5667 domain-containing protein [Actinobacteria bacterium]|nr:DUF5667 domain-containing protein [Actinomycetota bacterium]